MLLLLLVAQKDCAGAITVVLKVGMHCEDCAHKVRRSLNTFVGECLILSLFLPSLEWRGERSLIRACSSVFERGGGGERGERLQQADCGG